LLLFTDNYNNFEREANILKQGGLMITSVEKAKEKWCPFDKGQVSPREHSFGTCLGPDCMMWRFWVPPPGIQPSEISSLTTREKHGKRDLDKKGYCGLSGTF
jgi:hypothetical protein